MNATPATDHALQASFQLDRLLQLEQIEHVIEQVRNVSKIDKG